MTVEERPSSFSCVLMLVRVLVLQCSENECLVLFHGVTCDCTHQLTQPSIPIHLAPFQQCLVGKWRSLDRRIGRWINAGVLFGG